MKQLSAKQRAKIYRKAAEWLFNTRPFHKGACYAIFKVTNDSSIYVEPKHNEYIEFMLFKNKEETWWFDFDRIGHDERITALLLSSQIALNPIYK